MKLIIILFLSFILRIYANTDTKWWKYATLYHIFPWSFKDSDGDGFGDLAGITSKLDYLQNLGINAVKLSPIFSSPDPITYDYAVDDFKNVHSTLGSLEDIDELISEASTRGIKIILDINLNHCHITNQWFQKSVDSIEPYKNYFIWKDPITYKDVPGVQPPNFWYSKSGSTLAWKWVEKRKQFYYFTHDYTKPDFNLRNKALKEEINDMMKFWFDKGISGFNIVEKTYYFKDENVESPRARQINYSEIFEFMRQLREFIDTYNERGVGTERILMTDSKSTVLSKSLQFIGNKDFPMAHFVSNTLIEREFNYKYSNTEENMEKAVKNIKQFTDQITDVAVFEWVVYDYFESRLRNELLSVTAHTISAVLPGVWHIFYGSELGGNYYYQTRKGYIEDKYDSPYEYLTAMSWDDSINAGFTDSDHPQYLPSTNYWKVNAEKEQRETSSTYWYFSSLAKLRENETFKHGDVQFHIVSEMILAILRIYEGHETFITLVNRNNVDKLLDLKASLTQISLPPRLKVVAATPNFLYAKGDTITISRFTMRQSSAVVLMVEKPKI